MGDVSPGQFGLWIACSVTFIIAVSAFITAYRLLTKNFVTNDQLKIVILEVERRIEKSIETTRHALREEVNASFLNVTNKIEELAAQHSDSRASLARIEGALSIPSTPNLAKAHNERN